MHSSISGPGANHSTISQRFRCPAVYALVLYRRMKPADLHFFINPNRCIGCLVCKAQGEPEDAHGGLLEQQQ